MKYDVLILGRGPAGLAAAIGARSRGKSALAVGNPEAENPLARSPLVDNYPGLPGISGRELLQRLYEHAKALGAEFYTGRVLSALDTGESFFLTVGNDLLEGRQLILAGGLNRGGHFPGEEHFLGRGLSYCATCDGMLYRNKPVVVLGLSASAPGEAIYLSQIGCQVTYVAAKRPSALPEHIPFRAMKQRPVIVGETAVTGLRLGDELLPCQGIFLLRETVAVTDLLPGLETENGYLKVNRRQETNLPRVYAAGDCTGGPLQVAKAVGEGLVAGELAAEACETQP